MITSDAEDVVRLVKCHVTVYAITMHALPQLHMQSLLFLQLSCSSLDPNLHTLAISILLFSSKLCEL